MYWGTLTSRGAQKDTNADKQHYPGQDANEKLQPSDPSLDSFQVKDVNSIPTLQMKRFKTPFIYFFNLYLSFFYYSYLITKCSLCKRKQSLV